jgi:hypothetical protein
LKKPLSPFLQQVQVLLLLLAVAEGQWVANTLWAVAKLQQVKFQIEKPTKPMHFEVSLAVLILHY